MQRFEDYGASRAEGKEGWGERADSGLEMGLQKQAADPWRDTSYQ